MSTPAYKLPADPSRKYYQAPRSQVVSEPGETKPRAWALDLVISKGGFTVPLDEEPAATPSPNVTGLDRDAARAVLGSQACRSFLVALQKTPSIRLERLEDYLPDQAQRVFVISRLSRARLVECDSLSVFLTVEGRAFVATHEQRIGAS